jgi:hypothetical protein
MVAEAPEAPAGAIVAVGEAQDALAKRAVSAADVEGIKKLLTQTKAIGVILPPPDIRAIVDKTAQFVAKNGEGAGGGVSMMRCFPVGRESRRRRPSDTRLLLLLCADGSHEHTLRGLSACCQLRH